MTAWDRIKAETVAALQWTPTDGIRARLDVLSERRCALNAEIQAVEELLLERCIAEAVRREAAG